MSVRMLEVLEMKLQSTSQLPCESRELNPGFLKEQPVFSISKVSEIHLPLSHKCWDYMCAPLHPAEIYF